MACRKRRTRRNLLLLLSCTAALVVRASGPAEASTLFDSQQSTHHRSLQQHPQDSTTPAPTIPFDDTTLRTAVHEWVTNTDTSAAIAKYGPIAEWDTSRVTDMAQLFAHARFFDSTLSRWNTSSVTDMSYMFAFASSFQNGASSSESGESDLGLWDTSRVTTMKFMFQHASSMDGAGLNHWDVSQVKDLTYFAQGATLFDPNIWRWDTSRVRSFNRAFHNATTFSRSLCWHLHPQAVAVQTFCGAAEGAGFALSCGTEHATNVLLENPMNAEFHDCCDCEYSEDLHNSGYHVNDDTYWQRNDDEFDSDNDTDQQDKIIGIILASSVWMLVLCMMCIVGYVTVRRRGEVRDWLQTNLYGTKSEERISRGASTTAIATFVGEAATPRGSPRYHHSANNNSNRNTTTTNNNNNNNEEIFMVIGSDHVQYEGTTGADSHVIAAALPVHPYQPQRQQQPWVTASATAVVNLPEAVAIQDSNTRVRPEDDTFC